ncbi:MAG TPA: alpha/beta hydrolase-fold protein, partial [Terriglobia bacterium]|nr:alpha/beta hydrolase-fold protein [Terriglobia bacterium]
APTKCPWGFKAFSGYLGDDKAAWAEYDATELVKRRPFAGEILIDQGLDDKFLAEQLHPHLFEAAARKAGQRLTLRRHAGYDHGYFFIQSFMEDHLHHHASVLCGKPASPGDRGR